MTFACERREKMEREVRRAERNEEGKKYLKTSAVSDGELSTERREKMEREAEETR